MTYSLALFTRGLVLLAAALAPLLATAQSSDGPAALLTKYATLGPQLERNAFGRKLVLESAEASSQLSGNIYAVIDHPYVDVDRALKRPDAWCEVLMLHLNTKHCAVHDSGNASGLAVAVGRKFDQPVADAQRIDFAFHAGTAAANYLDVRLDADQGPLSTRNYRIVLEGVPIDGGRTFIHLGYSYAYGTAARLAMKGYLATLGSDKVGFTTTSKSDDGKPGYVGGVRGVVERNTMRYYLAIDAYLDAPGAPQLDQRLAAWFDATERYAPQLHEIDRADYLAMKQKEFKRMQSGTP
ncbi:MAG: hypothetical protein V4636_04685 [Pseudomonadota bacterium]